jgi:hypothetical protein
MQLQDGLVPVFCIWRFKKDKIKLQIFKNQKIRLS